MWVNIKEERFPPFSNNIPPVLEQAKLESLKNHEQGRGSLFFF